MEMHGGVARDGWNPLGIRRKKLLKDGVPASALVKSFYEMDEASTIGNAQHEFTLEVRVPQQPPYDLQGLFSIPAKLVDSVDAGAIVPVKVHPSEPDRVAIDWDGWSGERDESFVSEHRGDADQSSAMTVGAGMASVPDNVKSMMLNGWIDARRAGGLNEKDFNQALVDAVTSGMITEADAETARQQFA